MARTERCDAAREILQIRLHLAAIQEIIDELQAAESDFVRVAGREELVPVEELLERCLNRRDEIHRQLVDTN